MWPRWYKSLDGRRLPACDVIAFVGKRIGATTDELLGHRRQPKLVRGRWIVAAVLKERGLSYPTIGRALKRDHTTIMHGIDALPSHTSRDPKLATLLLQARIAARGGRIAA